MMVWFGWGTDGLVWLRYWCFGLVEVLMVWFGWGTDGLVWLRYCWFVLVEVLMVWFGWGSIKFCLADIMKDLSLIGVMKVQYDYYYETIKYYLSLNSGIIPRLYLYYATTIQPLNGAKNSSVHNSLVAAQILYIVSIPHPSPLGKCSCKCSWRSDLVV